MIKVQLKIKTCGRARTRIQNLCGSGPGPFPTAQFSPGSKNTRQIAQVVWPPLPSLFSLPNPITLSSYVNVSLSHQNCIFIHVRGKAGDGQREGWGWAGAGRMENKPQSKRCSLSLSHPSLVLCHQTLSFLSSVGHCSPALCWVLTWDLSCPGPGVCFSSHSFISLSHLCGLRPLRLTDATDCKDSCVPHSIIKSIPWEQ